MLLETRLPDFGTAARCTLIAWHAGVGDRLAAGAPLCDLRVDLSAGIAQDCPPVTTCRIVLGEAAWLRRVLVKTGDAVSGDVPLALLATAPDTPLDRPPVRAARTTAAAILHHADWWAGEP